MGVALLAGMRLARLRQFRAHARCQTIVMLLNLVMIALIMVPSFHRQVSPNLGKATADLYYALPSIHAALGSVAELLGLYVVLVALGVRLVPIRLRFHNYRAWMRTTLALWWIVIGFGVGTYGTWYAGGSAKAITPSPTAPSPSTRAAVAVTVRNFSFEPKELTVRAGTTVTWTDALGRHTVESADGFLKSDTILAGQTYHKRFDTPGVYDYYCGFHGTKNGTGMTGRIVVTAR